MCESNAFIKVGGKERLWLKDVVSLRPVGAEEWLVENLRGEQKIFRGSILGIDFLGHKLELKPAK